MVLATEAQRTQRLLRHEAGCWLKVEGFHARWPRPPPGGVLYLLIFGYIYLYFGLVLALARKPPPDNRRKD